MDNRTNSKRVAKNTVFLFLRMLVVICVGLYTSRIVLNTLGVQDFGIYNVVGGIVVLFSFLQFMVKIRNCKYYIVYSLHHFYLYNTIYNALFLQ